MASNKNHLARKHFSSNKLLEAMDLVAFSDNETKAHVQLSRRTSYEHDSRNSASSHRRGLP